MSKKQITNSVNTTNNTQKQNTTKTVQNTTKTVQTGVPTIVSLFKQYATEGEKTRKDVAKKISLKFKSLNITVNSKGKAITDEKILTMCGNILRDIKNVRKGWWSTYKIVENEKEFKIIKQEVFN